MRKETQNNTAQRLPPRGERERGRRGLRLWEYKMRLKNFKTKLTQTELCCGIGNGIGFGLRLEQDKLLQCLVNTCSLPSPLPAQQPSTAARTVHTFNTSREAKAGAVAVAGAAAGRTSLYFVALTSAKDAKLEEIFCPSQGKQEKSNRN